MQVPAAERLGVAAVLVYYGTDVLVVLQMVVTGRDKSGSSILTPRPVRVPGCRHRPLKTESARGSGLARQQESSEVGVAVATEWWETTAPAHPAILALQPSDRVQCNGSTYQIMAGGIKPFRDGMGSIVKVSILSELQTAGF